MKKVILTLSILLFSINFLWADGKKEFLVIQCNSGYKISLEDPIICSGDGIKGEIETTFKNLYHSGWKIDIQISDAQKFFFFLIKQK